MKKTLLTLSSAAIMLGGLAGCGAGNQATGNPGTDNRMENTRPIGYYTSENNPYATNVNNRTNRYMDHSGNAYELRDNDGPIIEMMDRAIINGDRNAQRNNTLTNRTANNDRGLFNVNTRNDQYADTNYHRHLNSTASRGKPSYYNNYQGELTEQIAARASRVRGVRDVRAVVYGNDVLVAVDTEANASETQVTRDVRRAVDPLVRNSDVRVVTDPGTFNRVRNVDNDIRDGGPMERLNEDIRSLFQTLTPGR
ncbi:YhcN/YlaJ family sporulation lipoprotein [Sutcliffiella cohnii]